MLTTTAAAMSDEARADRDAGLSMLGKMAVTRCFSPTPQDESTFPRPSRIARNLPQPAPLGHRGINL
ncbi:hypothetical protein S58_15550 [Bradyrhizobium oligotrophicum S58]|uniref:Uncharacterized protein n=1 Tax=Bradyrhizobium oligotrophicum S58 TaxID=1245469 RepID=M4Z2S7_9BRAD|nr:hypothetical protein S58_15550 [Bradyrhizobium oligotrophicum S58]